MLERTELWPATFVRGVEKLAEAVCAPSTLEYGVRDAARRRLAEFYGCNTLAIRPLEAAACTLAELAATEIGDPDRVRLAVEYADRFALSHRSIDDELLTKLRSVFNAAELAELAALVHTFEGAFKTTLVFRSAAHAGES